jgi:putative spermidine/putrescine transport system permease protein
MMVFLLAPLVVVMIMAFTPYGYLSFPTTDWSLRWFRAIFQHSGFIRAFWNSIYLGLTAATLSIVVAIPAALAIARYQFTGRQWLTGFFLSPLMIPRIVLGVAFLRFFSEIGVAGSFISLVLAHIIIITPYALRLVLASAMGIGREGEWAALSLGASSWTAFRRVTLPAIFPGIAGGWMLAFIISFDELPVTMFVASPSTRTLPVQMYNYITQNLDPLVTSVSTVIIVITVVFMLVLDRIFGLDQVLSG